MSQLNSLPSPERRLAVVGVHVVVHVLVTSVLEPFYCLKSSGDSQESLTLPEVGSKVHGLRRGEGNPSRAWWPCGQFAQPLVGHAQPFWSALLSGTLGAIKEESSTSAIQDPFCHQVWVNHLLRPVKTIFHQAVFLFWFEVFFFGEKALNVYRRFSPFKMKSVSRTGLHLPQQH